MLYIYIILNINDVIHDHFRWEIIYYISKKYKLTFQSYIWLIYRIDIFLLSHEPLN